MKKALCLIAVLTLVAAASADVRVFVTTSSAGYGLNESANHNVPTFCTSNAEGSNDNALDYYNSAGNFAATGNGDGVHGFSVASYPPEAAPSGTIASPVEIVPGDWAYIWFQFRNEPKGAKINGLAVNITGPAGFATTYYVQNDMGGDIAQKRWDGTSTPAGYPEWHNNPQTMVAITAKGLVNGNDDPAMMFNNQSGTNPRTGVALLGAIDGIGAGTYNIDITNISYGTPPNPTVSGGVFHMIPEPASALLLGLVSLLIRRR